MQDILGVGVGPSGGMVSFSSDVFITDELDLTTTTFGIELIPSRPNHVPRIFISFWVLDQVSGNQTAPPTMRAGSNAGHNNTLSTSASPTNGEVNGAAGVVPTIANGPTEVLPHAVFPNTPVIMDVTAGATGTGAFAVKGRLVVAVTWFPVG